MGLAQIRWSPQLLAEADTGVDPCIEAAASTEAVRCTAVVASIAAASIAAASIAAVSIVGPESATAPCVGTHPIHLVRVVTMAASIAAASIVAACIAAVSRTGAVGYIAAASVGAVHTGRIEEAVVDKDGGLRILSSPPPPRLPRRRFVSKVPL